MSWKNLAPVPFASVTMILRCAMLPMKKRLPFGIVGDAFRNQLRVLEPKSHGRGECLRFLVNEIFANCLEFGSFHTASNPTSRTGISPSLRPFKLSRRSARRRARRG